MSTATQTEYFRTAVALPDEAVGWKGVDRNRNIVFGARLIQRGDLNDSRPWTVDEGTLDQSFAHGTKRKKGLKARFAHPTMSDDGLGTFLGYWKNLKLTGDSLVGDLYLSDSAFDTPKGDLGTYVLDRAEEDPESFGVSLATALDQEAMAELDRELNGDATADDDLKPVPLRFADVRAADVVDEPAATRGGLFDDVNFSDVRDLAPYLDWMIDKHFKQATPEALLEKARRFLSRKYGVNLTMTTDSKPADQPVDDVTPADDPNLNANPSEPEPTPEPPAQTSDPVGFSADEIARFREAFGHELGANLLCDGLNFEQAQEFHRNMLQTQVDDLTKENAALKEQLSALMGEGEPVDTGAPSDAPPEHEGAFRAAIRHRN